MLQSPKLKSTGPSLDVNIRNSELHWAMNMKKNVMKTLKKNSSHQRIHQRNKKCKNKHSTRKEFKKSWWKKHKSNITGLLLKMYQQSAWKLNNWNSKVIRICTWWSIKSNEIIWKAIKKHQITELKADYLVNLKNEVEEREKAHSRRVC